MATYPTGLVRANPRVQGSETPQVSNAPNSPTTQHHDGAGRSHAHGKSEVQLSEATSSQHTQLHLVQSSCLP